MKQTRPSRRDKAKSDHMVERIAQDITDKVHSAVSSSIDHRMKENGGDNVNRWNVIEEGIKSMSAATK